MSARGISRRNATAGGMAMLALAAASAGPAKADELDGTLIALCQEYHQIEDRLQAVNHLAEAPLGSADYDRWQEIVRPLASRLHDVRFDISQAAARTMEGLRAKASVVLADLADAADPEFLSYSAQEALGHSLARDILGRT